jgi:hypothetical protein
MGLPVSRLIDQGFGVDDCHSTRLVMDTPEPLLVVQPKPLQIVYQLPGWVIHSWVASQAH